MKVKKSNTFLSVFALLMILAIAPVTTGAFAQSAEGDVSASTDVSASGEVSPNEVDVEVDVETDVDADVEIDTETDSETDETSNDDGISKEDRKEKRDEIREERKQQRDDMKDRMKELRKEHRDAQKENRQEYRDQRAEDIKAFRDRIADEFGDKIRHFDSDVRHQPIDPDRIPDLKFDGSTSGYMIIGGQAWSSDIYLQGSAYHVTGKMWKVHSTGEIEVADRHAKLEMKGFARGNNLVLNGSGELDNGEKVRLFLRGHFAPTPESGIFAIAFTQAGVHNINTGERIPLMHVGEVEVFPTVDVQPIPAPEPVPFETTG